MPVSHEGRKRREPSPTIIESYAAVADSKNRIKLLRSKAKYFRVTHLSNGSFFIEPRASVPTRPRIDKIECVKTPRGARSLMRRLGAALDRLSVP